MMSTVNQFQQSSQDVHSTTSQFQGNFQQSQIHGGNPNANPNAAAVAAAQAQQQAKEINAITLCRIGQESVQEIIARSQELFQALKIAQPPEAKSTPSPPTGQGVDRKPKFQETLRGIKATFKRLRLVYEKLEEAFPSEKIVHYEAEILQKSESDSPPLLDDKKNTDAYKVAVEEYREIVEIVMLRNRHLKETIDHLRQIIWDVNTMLSMRKE